MKWFKGGGRLKVRTIEEGIPAPAGNKLVFKPGGFHLALIDLKKPIKPNMRILLELKFKHVGKMWVSIDAKTRVSKNKS